MAEVNAAVTAAERRRQTVQLLREHGHASVSKLSQRFGVSEVTIRKDLRTLEEEDLLVRTHGGAVLGEHFKFDLPFDAQAQRHAEEKRRVGAAAAARVADGDTLILSAGSTTAAVARALAERTGLTVFTNSIRIASDLLPNVEVDVLMPGGQLQPATASVNGPYAAAMLRDYAFRTLFLALDGCDAEGLYTTSMAEAHLQRVMIEVAERVVAVADASKLARRGLNRVCALDSVDVFITDARASDEDVAPLVRSGVKVERA